MVDSVLEILEKKKNRCNPIPKFQFDKLDICFAFTREKGKKIRKISNERADRV